MDLNRGILLTVRELGIGGSERQLAETARTLHGLGWNVHVGCFRDSGIRAQELRSAGVPVFRIPVQSFLSFSAVRGMAAFAQYAVRHKLVLTHSFDIPTSMFGTLAGRLSRRAVVISSQRSYRTILIPRDHRLLRITDKLVDAIIVNCEAIRQHLIVDENVPPERIHLCYNGIDTKTFFPAPARRPEFLLDATAVIGTVAVLRPEKGLPTLMEAFARVNRERPGVRLVIVGSGPLLQPLEDLASSLGVRTHVHFEPATAQVTSWLNAMDIFVLPSVSEALSNSLMEAMACGVAPIASDVGGNPELVKEAETGLLFPSGDAEALSAAIRRLVDDETLRRRIASQATSIISSEMTVLRSASRMAAIYSSLLEK